jgi:hypothetical protein
LIFSRRFFFNGPGDKKAIIEANPLLKEIYQTEKIPILRFSLWSTVPQSLRTPPINRQRRIRSKTPLPTFLNNPFIWSKNYYLLQNPCWPIGLQNLPYADSRSAVASVCTCTTKSGLLCFIYNIYLFRHFLWI